MSKKWNPKKVSIHRGYAPKKDDIDRQIEDVEKDNRYKAGRPAIIDGKPFIWTAADSEFVRSVCMRTVQNKKVVTDYIQDGMNNEDGESFNW